MFTRAFIAYSALLLAIIAIGGNSLFRLTEHGSDEYRSLVQKGEPSTEVSSTQQKRFNVHKQILSAHPQRQETDIKSEQSELVWEKKADSAEMVEHFHNLLCISQERFQESPPTQLIRTMQAQEAVFHYHSRQLTADNIQFARYSIPGYEVHENFTSKPFMQGEAKSAVCSFEDSPQFQAKEVKIKGEKW